MILALGINLTIIPSPYTFCHCMSVQHWMLPFCLPQQTCTGGEPYNYILDKYQDASHYTDLLKCKVFVLFCGSVNKSVCEWHCALIVRVDMHVYNATRKLFELSHLTYTGGIKCYPPLTEQLQLYTHQTWTDSSTLPSIL
jgi:hypothetical protein